MTVVMMGFCSWPENCLILVCHFVQHLFSRLPVLPQFRQTLATPTPPPSLTLRPLANNEIKLQRPSQGKSTGKSVDFLFLFSDLHADSFE